MMHGARILVTGAAGFVGRALCSRLLSDGADVVALVRHGQTGHALAALKGVAVIEADLSDRADVVQALAGLSPDIVFHLANGDNRKPLPGLDDARAAIADGPLMLVELLGALSELKQPPRCVVRAGSLAEYGPIDPPYREWQREEPVDSHAAGALSATRFATMLAPRLPFSLVTARLALTYGPGQSERFLIPSAIAALLRGEKVRVARPDDCRDLIYIDDVVEGLILIAETPFQPIVNLCTGISPTIREVVDRLALETGAAPGLVEHASGAAPGGVARLCGSPEALARRFGWTARIGLAEGLSRTVANVRQEMGALQSC